MYSLSACMFIGGSELGLKPSPEVVWETWKEAPIAQSPSSFLIPHLHSLSLSLSFSAAHSLAHNLTLSAQLSHSGAAICTLLVITLSAPKAVRRHPPGIYSRHKPSVLITLDPCAIYTQLPLTHPCQHANVYVFCVCVCTSMQMTGLHTYDMSTPLRECTHMYEWSKANVQHDKSIRRGL